MQTKTPGHSDLIDAVGAAVVARHFSLSPQRLYNWRKRGVPYRLRIAFARVAAERGVSPPANFFEEMAA